MVYKNKILRSSLTDEAFQLHLNEINSQGGTIIAMLTEGEHLDHVRIIYEIKNTKKQDIKTLMQEFLDFYPKLKEILTYIEIDDCSVEWIRDLIEDEVNK